MDSVPVTSGLAASRWFLLGINGDMLDQCEKGAGGPEY